MSQEITISGTAIPTPQEFHIERYNLTKAGRVATGEMKMDLIAKKRKFLLRYRVLSGTQLNAILDLIDGPGIVFFTVSYIESGTTNQQYVMQDIYLLTYLERTVSGIGEMLTSI